jgi:hypothetical protein
MRKKIQICKAQPIANPLRKITTGSTVVTVTHPVQKLDDRKVQKVQTTMITG